MCLRKLLLALCGASVALAAGASETPGASGSGYYLLNADRVFDARRQSTHSGWAVLVQGDKLAAVGPAAQIRARGGAQVINMPGTTLLRGLIDAKSHIFMHPYNESLWI